MTTIPANFVISNGFWKIDHCDAYSIIKATNISHLEGQLVNTYWIKHVNVHFKTIAIANI